MNVFLTFLPLVFACSIFSNHQREHVLHMHQRDEAKEQLLPIAPRETLFQKINTIAVATSPLWAPLLFSYFLDLVRAAACESAVMRINPESKLEYAGLEFKTCDVARVGLEFTSHDFLLSVLGGKIDHQGSYTLDLSAEVVKQSFYNTISYAVPRYAIPHGCARMGITHHENKVRRIWQALMFCPATLRALQEVERAKKMHEQPGS